MAIRVAERLLDRAYRKPGQAVAVAEVAVDSDANMRAHIASLDDEELDRQVRAFSAAIETERQRDAARRRERAA